MSHDLHVFFSLSLGSSQSSLSCTIDVRSIWCGKPKATHFCKGLVWLIIGFTNRYHGNAWFWPTCFSVNLCSIQFHPSLHPISCNSIDLFTVFGDIWKEPPLKNERSPKSGRCHQPRISPRMSSLLWPLFDVWRLSLRLTPVDKGQGRMPWRLNLVGSKCSVCSTCFKHIRDDDFQWLAYVWTGFGSF